MGTELLEQIEINNPSLATARWANPEYISEKYVYKPGSFWLGRNPHDETQAIGHKDDRHIFLCAATRAGKGRALIVNNLLLWPGSIVSIDPKGDNASVAAERRAKGNKYCEGMGQDTYVLDPMECAKVPKGLRAYYNPLAALDPEDGELPTKADQIADAMVITPDSGEAAEWATKGKNYLALVIMHVVTTEEYNDNPEKRNLVTVAELITAGNVYQAKEIKKCTGKNICPFEFFLTQMVENKAAHDVISNSARSIERSNIKTPKLFESIRESAAQHIRFLNSKGIRDTVTKGKYKRTFDIKDLRNSKKGISLFLSLPEKNYDPYARWLKTMITVTLDEMQEEQGLPKNGHPLLFSIDEFTNLGTMPRVEKALNSIAGAGVKLFIAVQTIGDLKKLYKESWEKFISGAGVQIWFSAKGLEEGKYLQEALGETEIVKIGRAINSSTSKQHTEGQSEGYGHSQQMSQSETFGTGENSSTSNSHSDNQSSSRSMSKNWGTSKGINSGKNKGKQAGRNYTPGMFWSDDLQGKNDSANDGQSWGKNRSKNKGKSKGHSNTVGSSNSHSQSTGTSSQHSLSQQSGESTSHQTGTQSSDTTGSTQGGNMSETFHKKPLLMINEIDEYLAPPDEIDHPAYPGMALIRIAGELPTFVRKANYDQDPKFKNCFSPNPAYEFLPFDKLPILGFQYTPNHYMTISVPEKFIEREYSVSFYKELKKNEVFGELAEFFDVNCKRYYENFNKKKMEEMEWWTEERIKEITEVGFMYLLSDSHTRKMLFGGKIIDIHTSEKYIERGDILTVRFDFPLTEEHRKRIEEKLWGFPLKQIQKTEEKEAEYARIAAEQERQRAEQIKLQIEQEEAKKKKELIEKKKQEQIILEGQIKEVEEQIKTIEERELSGLDKFRKKHSEFDENIGNEYIPIILTAVGYYFWYTDGFKVALIAVFVGFVIFSLILNISLDTVLFYYRRPIKARLKQRDRLNDLKKKHCDLEIKILNLSGKS